MAKKSAKKASRLAPKTTTVVALQSVGRHTYLLVYVPDSCTNYELGDRVEVMISEPPPESVQLNLGPNCHGCIGVLDD